MSKPDIWMPVYIADYLADTQHLSTEEHGAYLLLLMAAWMRGGELPADDNQLMRICRSDKSSWKKIKPVISEFFEISSDKWIQLRLAEEYEHAVRVNNAQKENGKKGGRPKLIKTEDETQEKPMGFDSLNPNTNPIETPTPTPSLKPSELTHSKETNTSNEPTLAARVCLAIKEAGIPDVNPHNPTLLALLNAGATVEEFKAAAEQTKIHKFAYVLGVVKGMREEASNLKLVTGTMKPKESQAWRADPTLLLAKAKELKVGTAGLTHAQLLAKVDAKIEQSERQVA